MAYQYGGKDLDATAEEAYARAKFAYFRQAEAGINASTDSNQDSKEVS